MFAVGVNSSAKDFIETIKRPDAIVVGYIRQFVKLVTIDGPFITTDYMVCSNVRYVFFKYRQPYGHIC